MTNNFYFFGFLFSQTFLLINCNKLNIVIKIDINSPSSDGQKISLQLSKPDDSVIHPNIKVISFSDTNENIGNRTNGKVVAAETWEPTNADISAAHDNLYIDKENLAAVRLTWDDEKQEHVPISGVVNGNKIERGTLSDDGHQGNQSDYIDVGRKITTSRTRGSSGPSIVETLIVVDKEFGDIFNHDRQKILDYFTVYFWDINMRYKTLSSSNIAFQITGIVIINSRSSQPFIEEARDSDGRISFGRILNRFGKWVYNHQSSLPKFDMAISITNAEQEWGVGGGVAYFQTACWSGSDIFWSVGVWSDDGAWRSVTTGAHEIGHILGAPHDNDPNHCDDKGYIMAGDGVRTEELQWFFSTCTDRKIGEFVKSDQASCLKRQDEGNVPAVPSDFTNVLAPTMEEQCQRRLNNPDVVGPDYEESSCKVMKCWLWKPEERYWIHWNLRPVDNTPCRDGNSRCFRGRCRKNGNILMNVGSGKCAKTSNAFHHMKQITMVPCPDPTRGATPLDKFVVEKTSSYGNVLMTPWNTPDANENGDKCIYTGYQEEDGLWTDKCNLDNPWQSWNMIDLGNGEFMLSHWQSERCAKHEASWYGVYVYANCDRNDRNMRWKLL